MGIGHTWHLQLHTLSGEEKGHLIYDSKFRRAGEAVSHFPFLSFPFEDRSYPLCPQIVYMHSRGVDVSESRFRRG